MNDRSPLVNIIECLIFVSKAPLTIQEISNSLKGFEEKEISDALSELEEQWDGMGRSFILCNIAGGYQFRTRPEYSEYIVEFNKEIKKFRLSKAALEVLAIVAYKQPVTKIEVEKIRGVDCSSSVSVLLERRFIEISGRKDVPGKPFLYRTTDLFLETFGLKNIKDLPPEKE
ncbi:MAG: SMC-Scp complex subunit ScpB [Candidatus Dadabacteria bacterium]|nr:SMC-Scp complex subunit ScpB [Candidatus Dadabacteria bacterium]